MYKAVVSAHMWQNEKGEKAVEVFNLIHNDQDVTGIFDDMEYVLRDQVEPEYDPFGDYYFIALVESQFAKQDHPEHAPEYDVEHEVVAVTQFEDIVSFMKSKEGASNA